MRARIQRLTTEANPQQAMLEVIRLLRDINWTDSGIVEFAVLNDIEMALLPEKRVWRAFPGAELTETYSPPAVATGTSLLALFAMQEAENSW